MAAAQSGRLLSENDSPGRSGVVATSPSGLKKAKKKKKNDVTAGKRKAAQ